MARDPICGRTVGEGQAFSSEYKLRRYFFCSERCRSAFHHQVERLRMNELWRAGSLFSTGGIVRWARA